MKVFTIINSVRLNHTPKNGEQYEKCVLCDELTSVRKEQPIEYRDFYIPGCGQLCYDCYHKIYPGAENIDELPADECR